MTLSQAKLRQLLLIMIARRFLLSLTIALAFFALTCAHSLASNKFASSCTDPLQCYLANLVIPLPDFDADGFTFTEVVLKDITLSGLPSKYIPETNINFGVQNLGALVQAQYKNGIMKGTMSAELSDTDYNVDLYFNKTSLGGFDVPSGISYVPGTCEVSGMVISVKLNGTPHPAVNAVLKTLIQTFLCTTLGEDLSGQVTAFMQTTLDPRLLSVMDTQPDTPVPFHKEYVAWNKTIIGQLHKLFTKLASSELIHCVQVKHPALELPVLAHFVDDAVKSLTHGTGIFSITFSEYPNAASHFVLPIGNGSLSLLSVSLGGLDTFLDLQVLEPAAESAVSMSTSFTVKELQLNMTMLKTYNAVYNETIRVSIVLKNAMVSSVTAILVDLATFNSLHLYQLNVPCLLSALESVQLTSLVIDVDVSNVSLIEVAGEAGTLENDITNFGNTLFSLFTDGFGTFITDMLAGVVQGPVRQGLNGLLAKSIAAAKEQAVRVSHLALPTNGDVVVLSESPVLKQVNHFMNDIMGPDGINSLMNCLTNNTGTLSVALNDVTFKGNNYPTILLNFLGLNTFSQFSVLKPTGDYTLESAISVGTCQSATCEHPFGLEVVIPPWQVESLGRLKRSLSAIRDISVEDALNIVSDAQLSVFVPVKASPATTSIAMLFSNFELLTSTTLELNWRKVLNLNVKQVHTRGCDLSTFDDLSVFKLDVSASDIQVVVNDGASTKDVSDNVNKLFNAIRTRGAATINKILNNKLQQAPATCLNNGVPPPKPSSSTTPEDNVPAKNWEWELG